MKSTFLQNINDTIISSGLSLLPKKFDTREARAMLLSIGLQESRFIHTSQIRGPAKGYYQFERGGGYAGVLRHPATKDLAVQILANKGLSIKDGFTELSNDHALSTAFARLLLYTHPSKLPDLWSTDEVSWDYYVDVWRPGKPHRQTWDNFRDQAVLSLL